jgi:putative two-component system response regulator
MVNTPMIDAHALLSCDSERQTLLLVDDVPDNIALLSALFQDHYKIRATTHGMRALEIAASEPQPDLILLDIMMPDLDGYAVCQQLKADPRTAAIPVIFLTAKTSTEDEERGFQLGAVDYLIKPVSPTVARARIETHLALKNARQFLQDRNAFLEAEVRRRSQEMLAIQDATIIALVSLAETRESGTGSHIRRTQHYMLALAQQLQDHPRFAGFLSNETLDLLFKSAPLHDIGKVGIPDRILLKPGKLSAEEFAIMKTHTTLGRDAIPIAARLMAVADVYDELTGRRIYRAALPHEQAVEMIRVDRGVHFDPDVVDAFLAIADTFKGIAARLADDERELQRSMAQLEAALAEERIVLGSGADE